MRWESLTLEPTRRNNAATVWIERGGRTSVGMWGEHDQILALARDWNDMRRRRPPGEKAMEARAMCVVRIKEWAR